MTERKLRWRICPNCQKFSYTYQEKSPCCGKLYPVKKAKP